MITDNPAVLAQIVGFGVFLWLGLYVLVRGARRTPLIVVSLVGLFAQAIYFCTGALTDTRADAAAFAALQRWTLWTSVLPAAAWFHFSSLVARRAPGRRAAAAIFPPLVVASYTAGALLILFGTTTDLIVDFAHPVAAPPVFVISPGPGFGFFMLYLALTAAGAFANLLRARRALRRSGEPGDRALAQQLGVLAAGALFFLGGALWIAARNNWSLPISVLPGYLGLFVGLGALGYGVAHFGLLLDGQNVQRDFLYTFTGIVLTNLVYGGLLALAGGMSVEIALALVGLVTLTHTTFDSGRMLLDTFFFSRAERDARAEARDYATALGTAPVAPQSLEPEPAGAALPEGEASAPEDLESQPADELSYKVFKDQVRKAITGLKSPPQLAKSPLLTLPLVELRVAQTGQEDNRLNRAAALRELLIERIESLRPAAGDPSPASTPSTSSGTSSGTGSGQSAAAPRVGEAWRFYNVLYYPYVRELSRKGALAEARRLHDERRRAGQREPGDLEHVLSWLADVDEDTFYKWQRRASDTIATILWEEQHKLLIDSGVKMLYNREHK